MSRSHGAGIVTAVALFSTLHACTSSAVASEQCTLERRRSEALARRLAEEWPLRTGGEVSALVDAVAQRLARGARDPGHPWRVTVIRDQSVKAYSIGGGRIYVSDGALRAVASESELAAILAHEMMHELRHRFCGATASPASTAPDRIQQVGPMVLEVEPERERDADEFALVLMDRAGYDPHAALRIARRAPADSSSDHVVSVERIAHLESLLRNMPGRRGYQSDAFLRVHRELLREARRWSGGG